MAVAACEHLDAHVAQRAYEKQRNRLLDRQCAYLLVSVGVRLATFNLPQVTRMTDFDEMEIPSIGERKTVVYCCIPDNDSSFNYLIGMFYTQVFQQLYHLADHKYGGRLPVHVHFVMDEFANIALPDDFEKLLATGLSFTFALQVFAIIGGVSGFGGDFNPFALIGGAKRLSGIFVGSRRMLEDLSRFLSVTGLHPAIGSVFPFEQAREAYAHLERAGHFGKVVIQVCE